MKEKRYFSKTSLKKRIPHFRPILFLKTKRPALQLINNQQSSTNPTL